MYATHRNNVSEETMGKELFSTDSALTYWRKIFFNPIGLMVFQLWTSAESLSQMWQLSLYQ